MMINKLQINNLSLKFWRASTLALVVLVIFMSLFDIKVKSKNSDSIDLSPSTSQSGIGSPNSRNPSSATNSQPSAPVSRSVGGCGA